MLYDDATGVEVGAAGAPAGSVGCTAMALPAQVPEVCSGLFQHLMRGVTPVPYKTKQCLLLSTLGIRLQPAAGGAAVPVHWRQPHQQPGACVRCNDGLAVPRAMACCLPLEGWPNGTGWESSLTAGSPHSLLH